MRAILIGLLILASCSKPTPTPPVAGNEFLVIKGTGDKMISIRGFVDADAEVPTSEYKLAVRLSN